IRNFVYGLRDLLLSRLDINVPVDGNGPNMVEVTDNGLGRSHKLAGYVTVRNDHGAYPFLFAHTYQTPLFINVPMSCERVKLFGTQCVPYAVCDHYRTVPSARTADADGQI